MMQELGDLNNEVIIAKDGSPSGYAWAIIIRMQPIYYEKYKCVKVKVIGSLLNKAEAIINFLNNVGIEEVKREKKELVKDDGYVYPNAYEITLSKKMSIDYFESEEDRKIWKKIMKDKKLRKEILKGVKE